MSRIKAVKIENDHPLPDWFAGRMAEAGIEHVLHDCRTVEGLERVAADADIVWMFSDRRLLRGDNLLALKKCGAILRAGSGTDNVDVERATELGIVVANTPYSISENVCDHTIALLLSLIRQITRQDRAIRRGGWDAENPLPLRSPRGATLGLVAFGRIARCMARKLHGFEMKIVATDPQVDAESGEPLRSLLNAAGRRVAHYGTMRRPGEGAPDAGPVVEIYDLRPSTAPGRSGDRDPTGLPGAGGRR